MTKTELTKAMRDYTGCSFISCIQLAGFMGYKKADSVRKYLYHLEPIGKRYFIPDVAEQMLLGTERRRG